MFVIKRAKWVGSIKDIIGFFGSYCIPDFFGELIFVGRGHDYAK